MVADSTTVLVVTVLHYSYPTSWILWGMILLSLLGYYLGQHSDICQSSVMPGIGLGPPDILQKEVVTWGECRDLCCKNSACVTWTFLLDEQVCFLRNQHGRHVLESKNQISGITSSYVLPAPNRSEELLFYIGILSAPIYSARVSMLSSVRMLFWQLLLTLVSDNCSRMVINAWLEIWALSLIMLSSVLFCALYFLTFFL